MAGCSQQLPIRRESSRPDSIRVPNEAPDLLAGGNVPEARGRIQTGSRQVTAIGREARAAKLIGMTGELLDDLTGLSVYERIAALLLRLTGAETGLRAWMQTNAPELDNEIPMALLLGGEGDGWHGPT